MLVIAQLNCFCLFFSPRFCSIWWTLMPHTALTCLPRSFAYPGMSSNFNSSLQNRFFPRLSFKRIFTDVCHALGIFLTLQKPLKQTVLLQNCIFLHWTVKSTARWEKTHVIISSSSPASLAAQCLLCNLQLWPMKFLFLPSTRTLFQF